MTLSTHVLDTARGVPATGIAVTLFAIKGSSRALLAQALTNADGRTDKPLAAELPAGTYELVFAVGPYFARRRVTAFYADVPIRFVVSGEGEHCHVPLLLSPWGYSTYRGS
ncbi:MAG: hydroxyisourate hydrolase [Candidatus Velthaea sp.]|jgi:5-hydroxyisourate hydrolase